MFQQAKATHKLKTVKKIRAVRSGITTRVNKTGAEFWSSLPSDLLRRSAYNADVVRAARVVIVVAVVVVIVGMIDTVVVL